MKLVLNTALCATLVLSLACTSTGSKKSVSNDSYLNGVLVESSVFSSRGECKVHGRDFRLTWKDAVNAASACSAKKKWDDVEAIARRMLEVDGSNPWGHYFLSLTAQGKEKTALAHWHLDKALEIGPKFGLFLYQRGLLFWSEQKRDAAIRLIKESIASDTGLAEAHLFMGQIYLRDFDYQLANHHLSEVLKLRPGHSEAIQAIEICKKQISDGGTHKVKNDLAQVRGEK